MVGAMSVRFRSEILGRQALYGKTLIRIFTKFVVELLLYSDSTSKQMIWNT